MAVECCITLGNEVVTPSIPAAVLLLVGGGSRIGVAVGSFLLVVVAVGRGGRGVVVVVVGLIVVVAGLGKLTGFGPVYELESRDR